MKKLLALMLLLPGVVMAQPYPKNSVPERSIRSFYGALGGTNDDTVVFQAALYSGVPTFVDPSTNYTVSNLFLTNGSCLRGINTKIFFKTNAVGSMFYGAVGISNVFLSGLVLDGLKYGFTGFGLVGPTGDYPFGGTVFSDIIRKSSVDRSGIVVCSSSVNSIITHCSANGFAYAGFSFFGAVTVPQPQYTPVEVDNCNASLCWIGFETATNAEYMRPINITTAACGRGLSIESGNNHFTGGQDTTCGVAVRVGPGQGAGVNSAHSTVASRTMNHCAKLYEGTGYNNGFSLIAYNCLGGGGITLSNCTGTVFQNGYYGGDTTFRANFGADIIVDGAGGSAGMNYFINNGVVSAHAQIVTPNSGLMTSSGNYNMSTGGVLPYTNSWTETFTGASNAFTSPVYVPNLIVSGSGGLTLPTNSTAPGNTTTIRVWVTVTNSTGGVFKMPLYQ